MQVHAHYNHVRYTEILGPYVSLCVALPKKSEQSVHLLQQSHVRYGLPLI